jgi:T3SS (YopN, CesT) and YbjN peptide-binding chaperone 3
MRSSGFWLQATASVVAAIQLWLIAGSAVAQTASSRIDEALQNISTLVRAGRVGYAAFWDGNKYVQCRRMPDRQLRCEAAGTSMQPSLRNALTGERLARLATFGWALDPGFGNYAQTFSADTPTSRVADQILQTLTEAYGADPANLEVKTDWVDDVACPPRNGPSQNLAGLVNDAPSMRKFALHACSYAPDTQTPQIAKSPTELIALYGATATAEIQRLRINGGRTVYVSFNAGIGYVQCMPEMPPTAMYCEAQSAESWPALTTILTDERVSRLRNAGYADPGRAPNYWKSYPLDKFSDAAIATELLTILHEVYGYTGATKLKILTE